MFICPCSIEAWISIEMVRNKVCSLYPYLVLISNCKGFFHPGGLFPVLVFSSYSRNLHLLLWRHGDEDDHDGSAVTVLIPFLPLASTPSPLPRLNQLLSFSLCLVLKTFIQINVSSEEVLSAIVGTETKLIPSYKSLKIVIVLSRKVADIGWFNQQVPISSEFCK